MTVEVEHCPRCGAIMRIVRGGVYDKVFHAPATKPCWDCQNIDRMSEHESRDGSH